MIKNIVITYNDKIYNQIELCKLYPKNHRIKIICICNHCEQEYKSYIVNALNGSGLCKSCRTKRSWEKLDKNKINKKRTSTCLQKYNCENVMQNENIKQKLIATNLQKYGCKYSCENEQIKQKKDITCLRKYGNKCSLLNTNVKEKSNKTNLQKYGTTHPIENITIKEKAIKSLYLHGKQKCSKQQKYICELVKGQLNVPIGIYTVDILLNKVYIEYDGSGHDLSVKLGQETKEKFMARQMQRYKFLKTLGYKKITIISKNDKLPKNLLELLTKCLDIIKKYNWVELDLQTQLIKTKEGYI